jgi:DNA-binding MarR family transcriptional regulator
MSPPGERPDVPPVLLPLGPVLDFLRLIWAVDHAVQRTSRRMETALGVTAPQRLVIRLVGRFPGLPAGTLAQLLHVHPGTMSGVLKRIERQGFIRRRADPRDRRRVLLGLTDKGRSFDVEADDSVEAALARALSDVPAQKLEAAREVLQAIALAMARDDEPEEGY